ncbi:hypothetical protein GCM10011289_12880 [Paludibacterium paludis]|uniref:Uncharacterized protein n=1 Tax=Paludibacterium paludis TaxID=1225769 RepID=A0A918P0Z1_9NEIS|nr:hypothetical protein GCM10011289_12880 [Paludibacterium paludis]
MNDAIHRVIRQNPVQCLSIANVGLVKGEFPPGDALHAPERFGFAVAEVINGNDVEACLEQLDAGVRADVSGCARDKYGGFSGVHFGLADEFRVE